MHTCPFTQCCPDATRAVYGATSLQFVASNRSSAGDVAADQPSATRCPEGTATSGGRIGAALAEPCLKYVPIATAPPNTTFIYDIKVSKTKACRKGYRVANVDLNKHAKWAPKGTKSRVSLCVKAGPLVTGGAAPLQAVRLAADCF